MTSERPPAASVDSVREELRRLGYFESGLDRFVLGGARPSSSLAAAWRVAWRTGVAGGGVFGIALTLLAVSLEPQGSIDASDLALLFVYLGSIAFAITTLVTLGLGLLTATLARGAWGRRSTLLPRIVSAALAGSGALYLVFWWRSHGAVAAPLTQAIFLLIGAAVSGLLGRFGALASVAVLSAAGAVDRVPEAALSRRHLLPLFLLCAAVLVGSLAMARQLEARASETPDFAVVPTGLRVRVVGIDGFERRMAEQMIARGEAPHLAALLERGARATLRAEPEQVPAIVWTTIATGRGPEAHGIRSAGTRRLPGMTAAVPIEAGRLATAFARATELVRLTRQAPPSAPLRGAKTFWNVASEKGLRVGVVNWWATWPADPVNGFLVSDRAFLKLEKSGANESDVHPEAAFLKLRPLAAAGAPTRPQQLDLFHSRALGELSRDAPPDLEAVYLNGLDVFTMQTLRATSANVADLDARLQSVREYYRFLDEQLGRLAEGVGPTQVLVLVGDPGRFARRADKDAAGLLLIAGGPVVAQELPAVSERDLAPTALHLVGVPASRELAGRVIEQAFDPGFRKLHPVRFVDGYGRRPRSRPAESAFDKDVLEELRSLGYIQ